MTPSIVDAPGRVPLVPGTARAGLGGGSASVVRRAGRL